MKMPLIIEEIQSLEYCDLYFTLIKCKKNFAIVLTEGKLLHRQFAVGDILMVKPSASKVQNGVVIYTDPEIIIQESFIMREK